MSAEAVHLIEAFRRYFEIVPAETAALRDEVFRIRFEVYCHELGYEPAAAFPDGRERNEFDERSLHCLLRHRPSGVFAGCVRLVLNNREGARATLPFERTCGASLWRHVLDPDRLPRAAFGEISRLAVVSAFRRRAGEHAFPHGVANEADWPPLDERRVFPHIALGLYLAAAALALREEVHTVFAMMEPRLARHMRRYGIVYTQAGDIVEHRGQRGPFFIDRDTLYSGLGPDFLQLLELLHADLDSRRSDEPPEGGAECR